MGSELKRVGPIDTLRGFSILAVLSLHSVFPANLLLPPFAFDKVVANGYYGVTMFFVISGFLITKNLLMRYGDLPTISVRNFYAMRFARIAPCLILFLLMAIVLHEFGVLGFYPSDPHVFWSGVYSALTFQYNYFYLSDAVSDRGLFAMSPLWSLSIEEVFYILLPIICVLARRRAVIIGLLCLIIPIAPLYRSDSSAVYLWWGCADGLSLGCLTALAANWISGCYPASIGKILRVIGIVTLIAAFYSLPVTKHFSVGPSIVAAATAMILLGITIDNVAPSTHALNPLRIIRWLGQTSYELYVFHFAFIIVIRGMMPENPRAATPLALVSVCIFCWALATFVNEPLNRKLRELLSSPFKPVLARPPI